VAFLGQKSPERMSFLWFLGDSSSEATSFSTRSFFLPPKKEFLDFFPSPAQVAFLSGAQERFPRAPFFAKTSNPSPSFGRRSFMQESTCPLPISYFTFLLRCSPALLLLRRRSFKKEFSFLVVRLLPPPRSSQVADIREEKMFPSTLGYPSTPPPDSGIPK